MHRLRYLIVVNLLVCKLHLLLLLCNLFISFLFGVRVVSHLHMIFLLRLTQQLLFILQPVPQILTPLHHLFVLGDVILLMTIKSLNQFSLYAYRHIINNPYCLIQRQLRIKQAAAQCIDQTIRYAVGFCLLILLGLWEVLCLLADFISFFRLRDYNLLLKLEERLFDAIFKQV